ncbi:intraflagellar transport protein 172 homolog isoform X1 [Agrilus planipennis]|nr:intraflagellar transport protein 172 homolog isoform X1 [Agrilus planipennis]
MESLDLLAEQGHWTKCIEKAKAHGLPILHKYLALYATSLLKDSSPIQAVKVFNTYGTPAISQNFKIYNRIVKEMLALNIDKEENNYEIWSELRQMLHKLVENIKTGNEVNSQTKSHFEELLLIVHFCALRAICKKVPSLKQIAVKISIALLRYIDVIPADKAFCEAGLDLREEGRISEAFVFLNYYLDICEAIEEGDSQIIDNTYMEHTDIPTDFPLPKALYLQDDEALHDDIRQWVLTTSMDQNIDQVHVVLIA